MWLVARPSLTGTSTQTRRRTTPWRLSMMCECDPLAVALAVSRAPC